MTLDPGQMRTKLVLQVKSWTKDTAGQAIESWTDGPTIWAQVSPLSAREQWWAQQTHATTTHTVVCRYRPDVLPTCRFRLGGGRILNIDGVRDVDERRVELVVSCTEQIPPE